MQALIYTFFALFALMVGGGFYAYVTDRANEESYNAQAFRHAFVIEHAHHLLGFDLVDPDQAPLEERDSVMRGYRLFIETGKTAPQYARNLLTCAHCHFSGGDKLGGKNGGISLVGVTAEYPRFSKRSGKTISLQERITNCFRRSMNGNAPPLDSKEMQDLISYLKWISKEIEKFKKEGLIDEVPWLGLPTLKSTHLPNAQVGRELYLQRCAACHRMDGRGGGRIEREGEKTVPPLWGPDSFNDGAGMHTLGMLSSFIYFNMPYQQADLTEEEALDIAAYVIEQERPKFVP